MYIASAWHSASSVWLQWTRGNKKRKQTMRTFARSTLVYVFGGSARFYPGTSHSTLSVKLALPKPHCAPTVDVRFSVQVAVQRALSTQLASPLNGGARESKREFWIASGATFLIEAAAGTR